MNDLEKLFLSELRNIHHGESQLVQALAEVEKHTPASALQENFHAHREETLNHINRLDLVFEELKESPGQKICHGLRGIVQEGKALHEQFPGPQALAAAALKAEQYEIAAYGSLCSWANQLGRESSFQLLQENLREEKVARDKMSHFIETGPVPQAQLFLTELSDLHDGEHLLAQALAEVEHYANSKLLKLAVAHHLKQTEKHSARLEKVFSEIGSPAYRRRCQGLEGIIDEAQTLVEEFQGNSALDAALIGAGQKAEHYEIADYTILCAWARGLGHEKIVKHLEANLSDEVQTDKALTLLGENSRNPEAADYDSPKRSAEEASFLKLITHGG